MKRRIARLIGTERAVALPANTRSVLFVCHGNIMRSASAERFLQEDLETLGIADIRVSSAGTHARAGREADARVRRALAHLGVSLDGHRATPLTADLVASHDVIFAMDELNYVNILAEFPQSKARLRMLGGMSPAGMYHPHEIADPYTTGPEGVASTIREVRSCVAALSQVLANELALATPHRHMEQQQQPS